MMSTATLAPDATERLRERLKWFLFSRVLLASAFLGTLAVVYLRSGGQRYTVSVGLLLGAIVLTYGFTIASALLLLRLKRLVVFTYVQLGFDVLLTSGVVLVSGGGDSPFGFLYSLGVINAAALLSTPCALATALGSCVAYTSLIALLTGGAIPRPDYPFHPSPPDLQLVLRVGTTDVTFVVIALLAGSLVRRLHQAERRLGQAEIVHHRLAALHEALARNIGCALITTDNEGAVTSLNHTAEEIAGQSAVDVIGKDVGVLFAALRHSPTGRRQFLQSATNVQPTEFVHRLADEREVTLRCSTVTLRDTYHNFIGTLYIMQDVTKLRELERRFEAETVADVQVPDLEIEDPPETNGLLGTSPAITRVHAVIAKVAKSDATLLITGESGTGKELVARAVHAQSARRDRPFIAVNCGAIPADLVESELFGHTRGAFTGAVAARTGLFRTADGGTIFLDEVGDLPLPLQVKLLRVLQERSFTPVGSDTHVTVDVRIIAATNRPLLQEVQAGRFREDLFYRLNVVTVELPPLRDRRQDIPLLVRRFLRQFSEVHGKHVQRLSVAAARLLQAYTYPGNVRELENIVEHGVALSEGETVHEQHLPPYALQAVKGERPATPEPPKVSVPPAANHVALELVGGNLDDSVAAYEKRILLRALAEAGGVKTRAAGILGINYRSLRHRLEKYSLTASLSELESESES
jgi:two-component system response regulator PilR (NtrC family)